MLSRRHRRRRFGAAALTTGALLTLLGCQWAADIDPSRGLASPGDAAVPQGDAAQPNEVTKPDSGTAGASDAAMAATCVGGAEARQTDPEHCGACGHSCRGRACAAGTCEREVVAELDSLRGSSCITRAGDRVYVADGANVRSFRVSGPPEPLLLARVVPDGNECVRLLFVEGALYLARWSDILRVDIDGRATTPIVSAPELITSMEARDGYLYYTTRKGLRRVAQDGRGGAEILEDRGEGTDGLSIGSSDLYFVSISPADTIRRRSIAGSAPSTVYTERAPDILHTTRVSPDGLLVLAGTNVYRAAASPGGALSLVAASLGIGIGRQLAIQDGLAYVSISGITGQLDGTIARVDPRTGAELLLAKGGFTYMDFGLDETHVYFGDFDRVTRRPRLVRVPR